MLELQRLDSAQGVSGQRFVIGMCIDIWMVAKRKVHCCLEVTQALDDFAPPHLMG
jgi:hypothetical protein